MMMLFHVLFAVFLSLALLFLVTFLGMRSYSTCNKSTPFECGFDPKDSARLPFSMRFFLLAVLFLIFDIEIALLFPIILGVKSEVVVVVYKSGLVFLLILMGGLVYEWLQGSLSWVY